VFNVSHGKAFRKQAQATLTARVEVGLAPSRVREAAGWVAPECPARLVSLD